MLRLLPVIAILLATGCAPVESPPEATETGYSATVVGISDGDTVTVLRQHPGGRREEVKIRLHGIDAPETRQPYGAKAKSALSSLIFGKTVRLDVRDVDRYGRTVAVIRHGDTNVNAEMIRRGMAWWYRQFAPNDKELERAEAEARGARRGLWADRDPIPPWSFRRN
jgi:micrococcal nuclease